MHRDKRGYWYRSKREGGHVVREYLGCGEAWALLAQMDEGRAEERRLERARLEAAQAQARAVDAPVEQIGADIERLLRQVLEACGYHLHARSQWRKRRIQTMTASTGKAIEKSPKKRDRLSTAEASKLIQKSRTDKEAAQQFLARLKEEDSLRSFVTIQDVAKQAEFSLIASFAGEDELVKEMCVERMKIMRRELAGDNPTPLERMLIERIALAWLHVHIIEMSVAQRHATMTLTVGEYQQKRLDKAHKRHLQAIMALAQVRKMQLPTPAPQVQINVASNVAEQQIVATPSGSPAHRAGQ